MKFAPVRVRILLLSFAITLNANSPAPALNEATHEVVNERALRRSKADAALKTDLAISGGIEQPFNGRAAVQWVREGGAREDEGGFFASLAGRSRFFRASRRASMR